MKKFAFMISLLLLNCFIFSQEIERQYFGKLYKTEINDNNVNVRSLPSTKSKVIKQLNKNDIVYVTGYSLEKDKNDGFSGYWIRISLSENANKYWSEKNGWIFSKYININPAIDTSKFKFLSIIPASKSSSLSIKMQIVRTYGKTIETTIYPSKMNSQNFYTFTWSDDEENFYFDDPVGTFTWDSNTNVIKHVSYIGFGCESAWCHVTNDLNFLLQDYGTSPGPRGLAIFDIKTNETIFSGSYYRDLDYDGQNVTIIKVYDSWHVKEKYIDDQSIKYAEDFIKKNTMTKEDENWKSQGGGVSVIVKYRFNINTRQMKYINSQYIHEQ